MSERGLYKLEINLCCCVLFCSKKKSLMKIGLVTLRIYEVTLRASSTGHIAVIP